MSTADIGSAEETAMNDDKPLFAGQSVVMSQAESSGGITAFWSTSVGGSDETDSDFPAGRVGDGYHQSMTKPDHAASTWYLHIDLGAVVVFDTLVLAGHNFNTVGLTSVTVRETDASWTSTSLIASFSVPSSNARLVSVNLDDGNSTPQRYSSRYIRITMVAGGAVIPEIGEVYLGRRRQMRRFFNLPFDRTPSESLVDMIQSSSGVFSPYVRNRGRRRFQVSYRKLADATTIDELQNWFAESKQGTKPSLFIPQPGSLPNNAYFVFPQPAELKFPFEGPFDRATTLQLVEHAPFLLTEV